MKLFPALVVLVISFYTFTYAIWLWRQKKRKGAWGVFSLTLLTLLYSFLVVFFLGVKGF